MDKIYLGKFVSTHGINGELKLLSDFEYKDRVFKKDFPLYIEDTEYKITNTRSHKQYELIKLNAYSNINEVLFLVNKDVYINIDDLNLLDNEYLLNDLEGATIIDNDKTLGKVTSILQNKVCDYVKVDDDYLIPLIDEYIIKFDKNKKVLYTKNAKDLKL